MDADYIWSITKDLLDGDSHINAVGTVGPSNAPDVVPDEWKPVRFRLRDDDGEVYYHGILMGADPEGLEPLDDFGRPNAGCTEIEHRIDGKWVTL